MLKRSEKFHAFKKGLYCESVGFIWGLFPSSHVSSGCAPRSAVPVVKQVRDVEELRSGYQLRRFDLVSAQLLNASFNGVAVLRILMFDNAHGYTVNKENYISSVALSCRWLE